MKRLTFGITSALCVLLSFPCRQLWASGTLLELPDGDFCYKQAFRKATFTPARYTYEFAGTCDLAHTRLALPLTVPWTAVGTFDPASGATTEVFTIPPPAISQPSRPYGEFRASLRCVNDPWLGLQENPQCVLFSALSNPPPTAFGPSYKWNSYSGEYFRDVLNAILDSIKGSQVPFTVYLTDDANTRKSVNAQYQSYLAAQKREQQLLEGAAQSQGTSYSASLSPSVLGPVAGQRFYNQSPVAIKLAMPKGWNVSSYLVKLQRKDAAGKWLDHANIPVGAAEAQSAAGYTGFGAGAPPAFLSLPGAWRLAAQASYPKQSGWSDWREFFVVTALHPPLNSRVHK
jgi:hypothetical protein